MPHYLPIMYDIRNKSVLIVGGGAVAHEKLTRISEWTQNITIISKEFKEECKNAILEKNLPFFERKFEFSDLNAMDIVIVAVDDLSLQETIYNECTKLKTLCNAVDLAEYCHFIFPSIIRKDDLIVAISTSGASPAIAKHLKRFFQKLIPNDIGEFLTKMRQIRSELPKGKERMKLLDDMAKEYVDNI